MKPARTLAVALRRYSARLATAIATVGLALAGCGISGGDGFDGIDGSGFATGPIQEVDGLVVADVEFDASSAMITIDGAIASAEDLAIGMFATVEADFAADAEPVTALAIRVASEVSGPVASIDEAAESFAVLGQTVVANEETAFGGDGLSGFPDLAADDVVRVSGIRRADGRVAATRIEAVSPTAFEVTGFVMELDNPTQTFMLADLTVDYAGAEFLDGDASRLLDGSLVRVEGSPAVEEDTFAATAIAFLDEDGPGGDGDDLFVQGLVTDVISPVRFILNGVQAVLLTPDTILEGESSTEIALDRSLTVAGFVEGGELVAEIVGFDD